MSIGSKRLASWALTSLMATSSFMTLSSRARAYSWHECNGTPSKWQGNSASYEIMRCSIPSGSQKYADVVYSFAEWNSVYGMFDVFSHTDGTTACVTVNHTNDTNEIFHGDLDGGVGATWVRYSTRCVLQSQEQWIIEADVGIDPNLPLGNPACNAYTSNDPGNRTTLVHELGHGLGLNHSDNVMALMMTSDGEGRYCGTHAVQPHGDDSAGGRFLYGSGNQETDIGASEFRVAGIDDVELNTTPGVSTLCPGDSRTFNWSVGNTGTTGVTFNVRWYLSTDTNITTGDILVAGNTGASIGANGFATFSRTVTIPSSAVRGTTYFLGTIVDWDGAVSETFESNNATYMARRIKICP